MRRARDDRQRHRWLRRIALIAVCKLCQPTLPKCRTREDAMRLQAFQHQIDAIYGERDAARGISATVAWIAEEVGELAQAVRKGSPHRPAHENDTRDYVFVAHR